MMLPVLPMPMLVSKRLADEHGTTDSAHATTSSFDLFAHLLNISASLGKETTHAKRRERQAAVEEELFAAIDALKEPPREIDDVWPIFCRYSRGYVSAFTGRKEADAMFFADPSTVDPGSAVWRAALDHAKGHDVFFGTNDRVGKGLAKDSTPTYEDLVLRAGRRLWWSGVNGQSAECTLLSDEAGGLELRGEFPLSLSGADSGEP